MTGQHQTIVGTALGSATAFVKAFISLGDSLETIWYAALGACVGFLVTEGLKELKKRIKQKKEDGKISP